MPRLKSILFFHAAQTAVECSAALPTKAIDDHADEGFASIREHDGADSIDPTRNSLNSRPPARSPRASAVIDCQRGHGSAAGS